MLTSVFSELQKDEKSKKQKNINSNKFNLLLPAVCEREGVT
jgi:hypothetical protein